MTVAMIRPLQRPVPLRQSVYDALIDLIVGGELPPGPHMVEDALAGQLGVGRQPIPEALDPMGADGMVAPERGRGCWEGAREMIDAIEAGTPERAQAMARRHTEGTREASHRPRRR